VGRLDLFVPLWEVYQRYVGSLYPGMKFQTAGVGEKPKWGIHKLGLPGVNVMIAI
jgi:hypothetical protein